MTPYEFGILLHYYASPRRPEHYVVTTDVWKGTLEKLVEHGWLVGPFAGEPYVYQPTEKTDVFIRYAIDTPEPVRVWVIPARTEAQS